MKDRLFEILLFVLSAFGLFLLFTLVYGGPAFVIRKIIGFIHGA